MPFKSKAQRRKFAELLVKGEITPETFEEWNRETGRQELPERVDRSKKKGKKKKAARRKTATRTTAKRKTAKRKTAKRKARKR
jgi:topoisomerase IA-like protein